jgi:trehalose 6-phosphate phosphatase
VADPPPALDALARRPERAGIFVDFDGTLADIVSRPEQARPVNGAVEVLAGLARSYRVVAVVSGRRAEGLARRLRRPQGVRCYGLYGLEDESGPTDPALKELHEELQGVLPDLERAAGAVPGAWVEPKVFNASIHYRESPHPDQARLNLLGSVEGVVDRAGLRLLEGKRVIEIAPRHGPSKGDVVERVALEERLEALLYAGDDLPDLEAFEAVARLRERGIDGVRIAVRSTGTPDLLLQQAELVAESPSALVEMLRGLVSSR